MSSDKIKKRNEANLDARKVGQATMGDDTRVPTIWGGQGSRSFNFENQSGRKEGTKKLPFRGTWHNTGSIGADAQQHAEGRKKLARKGRDAHGQQRGDGVGPLIVERDNNGPGEKKL